MCVASVVRPPEARENQEQNDADPHGNVNQEIPNAVAAGGS
jgi:hypothetical protein